MAGVAPLTRLPMTQCRRVASEAVAMPPDQSRAENRLIIERRYVKSRLALDLMAAAYESVVPVIGQTTSGENRACKLDSAEHRELIPGRRAALGA